MTIITLTLRNLMTLQFLSNSPKWLINVCQVSRPILSIAILLNGPPSVLQTRKFIVVIVIVIFIFFFELLLCITYMYTFFCREDDWNRSFNYSENLDFLTKCIVKTKGMNLDFCMLFFYKTRFEGMYIFIYIMCLYRKS